MIKSMTGYGRAQQQRNGRDITIELKSVNNRYLDCNIKLPRIYNFSEEPMKAYIKQHVARGKLDVFVTVQSIGEAESAISLNRPVLEAYLAAFRQIAEEYAVADDISVTALTKMPDVLTVQKLEIDEKQLQEDLLAVLADAVAAYNAMRAAEGAALQEDILRRAKTIAALTCEIEARSPQTVAEYRARLTKKMQEVLESTAIDEARILTEAAIYADKVAVDEETVRLHSHLDQLEQMLASGGTIGRKLDFLLQELNREANTIGSKCNDIPLARMVVDIKAELEKIREQVQNIE